MIHTQEINQDTEQAKQAMCHLAIQGDFEYSLEHGAEQLIKTTMEGEALQSASIHRMIGFVLAKQSIKRESGILGSMHAGLAYGEVVDHMGKSIEVGNDQADATTTVELGKCFRAIGIIASVNMLHRGSSNVSGSINDSFEIAQKLLQTAPKADRETNRYSARLAEAIAADASNEVRLANGLLITSQQRQMDPENQLIHNLLHDMKYQASRQAYAGTIQG